MRTFDSGATRDDESEKLDFEGFLSPLVVEEFAAYMHRHRVQSDGTLRPADNWQKGIPLDAYMKSAWRHFFDLWKMHRLGVDYCVRPNGEPVDRLDALCGLMFNVQGYLHSLLADGEDYSA